MLSKTVVLINVSHGILSHSPHIISMSCLFVLVGFLAALAVNFSEDFFLASSVWYFGDFCTFSCLFLNYSCSVYPKWSCFI